MGENHSGRWASTEHSAEALQGPHFAHLHFFQHFKELCRLGREMETKVSLVANTKVPLLMKC